MAEVYPTAIEDAQPIGLGRADSKSNQDVEAVKGVSDIELLRFIAASFGVLSKTPLALGC